MSSAKAILGLLAIGLLIALLYPVRQLGPRARREKVTEIVLMGVYPSHWDAIREFEKWSRVRHQRDPSKPIYRVISGQNASRDPVGDPTRFLAATAGGAPPDVIWFDRYAVAEWAARGAFSPLEDYLRRDVESGQQDPPPPTRDRFFEPCWNEANYQGHLYGIPSSADDRALFYNKDLLVRAGLVDEKGEAKPPQTWEELREYARKLTERDERGQITRVGFIPDWGNSFLYMYGWMNGGEFMSPDGRRCTLNDPRIVQALQYMKDIYGDLGGYQEVMSFEAGFQARELDPFIQGKVAIQIDTVLRLRWLAYYGMDVNFGIAELPLPEKEIERRRREGRSHLMSWCGGWAYCIPTTARRKEAAWEFIRFMTSERAIKAALDSDRALAEAQGRLYLPGQNPQRAANAMAYREYVLNNPRLPERFKAGYKVFNDLLPYSRYRPVTPVGQRLWNEQLRAVEAAMYTRDGHPTPRETLDDSTRVVQQDLDRSLSPPKGKPINSWSWFFLLYAGLLALMGAAAYAWDTRPGFRRRLTGLIGLSRRRDHVVIEGARGGYLRHQWWEGLTCAAPWVLGFVVFGGGPMLFSLIISVTDYDILRPPVWIGLGNYHQMLHGDKQFPVALMNTAFMLIGVPLGMCFSLAVALLLNARVRGMAAWRTIFYLPAIVPMVAASILWVWIFNPQGGAINLLLDSLHLKQALVRALGGFGVEGDLRWLQDPILSKPSLIIMGLWGAGASMIIWLAGLKAIPGELYEAASVDGANGWQQLWGVTIPQLTPYIFFNLTMGMIGAFQIFGQAYIMTKGGPRDSTLFYVYHLFNNAFRYGHMGYAAAMAWVLFAIVLAVTIFQLRLSRYWVYYEAE